MSKMKLTDVSVREVVDEPSKEEARVVMELVVHDGEFLVSTFKFMMLQEAGGCRKTKAD